MKNKNISANKLLRKVAWELGRIDPTQKRTGNVEVKNQNVINSAQSNYELDKDIQIQVQEMRSYWKEGNQTIKR